MGADVLAVYSCFVTELDGICRLRNGSLFPEGRIAMKIAAATAGWGRSRRC